MDEIRCTPALSKRERQAIAYKKWYEKNKESLRAKALARYHADAESHRERQRAYKARHKERLAEANRQRAKSLRAADPAGVRAADRAAYARNKRVRLIKSIRSRAAKNGISFDIEVSDLVWPTHCPILGMKLDYEASFPPPDNGVSVDRIIPSLGYVRGNVQVVSWLANRMKSNATPEQMLSFARYVIKAYGR
jgi:hypothetical protein